ncbi:MAG TPA: hypothetical protein VHD36_14995 [Pirellulales bacterium]|nr:hypothetical protein [Pirellulales bacterium]
MTPDHELDADEAARQSAPDATMSNARFALRVLWVAVQLVLVYWLDQQRELFFYQGF